MTHQNYLSYNLVFTSKANNSLLYIQNNRSTFTLYNDGISQSQNAMGHSNSTKPTGHERPLPHKTLILRLMKNFAIRKSPNEHGFFIAVISLNKIGEGRIRDLTGDILFHMSFKCPVQRPSKGEILAKAMTQFPMYVELNSTSLQSSGPSWISNGRPTPGMVILNTRFGLLNMILSSPLKMVMEMMLQNVHWSSLLPTNK